MKTKNLVAGLALIFSVNSMAALVIDYTGNDKPSAPKSTGGNSFSKKNLLLDNSVVWATFVESDKCLDKVLNGSGSNLPFNIALRLLTPNGWKVFADEGVSLEDIFVSWSTGAMWTKVIADAAEKNKFRVVFNCAKKEVTIQAAPELGSIDALPVAEFTAADTESAGVGAVPSGIPLAETAPPVSDTTTLGNSIQFNTQSIEPIPYGNESAGSYLTRYAKHFGFSRVAYRLRSTNIDSFMRKSVTSGNESKSFSEFIRNNNLIQLNGIDLITNEQVMIVTDDESVTGRSSLSVFPVVQGMLSSNATEMASALNFSIGENNQWPRERLESDYMVPYGYDIVMTEPIDGFSQLFSSYPVQAQFVLGGSTIFVVKRNTADKKD